MISRRGLTMVELLIASAVMAMIALGMAGLSSAVFVGSEHSEGQGEAVQHARVALERITRTVRQAQANGVFPGVQVVTEQSGSLVYANALVVWNPAAAGAPADLDGVPQWNELVLYCLHPTEPNRLVEITAPTDTSDAPAAGATGPWRTKVASVRAASGSKIVTLTNLLRVCGIGGSASTSDQRGVVWFVSRLRPSDDDLADYADDGNPAWKDLPWVQGIRGSRAGLRQTWVRIEMQLMPGASARRADPTGQSAIPFFDSAALYYELSR